MPPERSLTGRVVDPGGAGVPGVLVYADPRGLEHLGLVDDQSIRTTFTNPDGTFRIGGLGDFEVVLSTTAPPGFRRGEERTARGGDQGVVLVLARGLSARFRVTDLTGAPLQDAKVSTWGWALAVTDQHGVAHVEGLEQDAPITLRVDPPKGRADLCPVFLTDWTPADTEVRIPPGSTVSGTVVDAAGQPAPRAIVIGGNLKTTTDEQGEFELGPFPGSGVDLSARPPKSKEEFWRDQSVRVKPGASKVELVLAPCGDLEVRVADWPRMQTFLNASLTIEGEDPRTIKGYVRDGQIRFTYLPTGRTYTLFAEPDDEGRIVYAQHLRPGPDPVVVRLTQGGKISGTVVYPPGVTTAWVTAEGIDFWISADVGPEGAFVILGIPPGKCEVTAYAEDPHEEMSETIPAKAGDKLVLELE